jgi:ribosome-associated protein
VEARWQVQSSAAVSDEEKALLSTKYVSKITADGFLSATDQTSRSALSNQEKAKTKLLKLIKKGLLVPIKRKKTAIPRVTKEANRKEKERNKEIKNTRRKINLNHLDKLNS